MGMSASQARFLSLTARKTNVEYEGQQINQQRTALSNESSNYYSQLTSMTVPTPPVSADFMKVTYSFENGTETNVVTSLIATPQTRETGVYMLNYVQEIPVDTMVTNGTNVVSKILKPGKELVYSTCSILAEENEDIINTILKEVDAEIIPIDFIGKDEIELLPTKIQGTMCVAQNEFYEGFFVAKIRKIK